MTPVKRMIAHIAAAVGIMTMATVAGAQDYPNKPITIVAPFPPGASTDTSIRALLPKMTEVLGQPVVVDNRPGGSGTVGAAYVARAKPDGYTLVWSVNAPFTLVPFLMKDVPYDAKKDFKPVAWAANAILALAVHPSLPVNNVQELIDYAKAHPGELKFGSAGIGSAHQIAGEMMNKEAGINMVHVPYPGGGPAIADLVGGHIMVSFGTLPAVLPHAQTNGLKILAIVEDERYPGLPDIPTLAETVPGAGIATWVGLLAPAGTPDDVVAKLNNAVNEALKDPEVQKLYAAAGYMLKGGTPEDLAKKMDEELVTHEKLLPEIGIEKQ
ncbi:MAG TPA: tripartite tricarboxylate transporter substrate binding protein [Rhizobiaceae bacterium]|nr:tripartite tricarboxylate transporter substrate binding protein [Rhizobiaceae bacterium]